MWGIIPIKNVNEAKHRLDPILSPKERRDLFVVMFEDVLATMMKVSGLERVSVATICPKAGEIARRNGASILSTGLDRGQTAAVAIATITPLVIPASVKAITISKSNKGGINKSTILP